MATVASLRVVKSIPYKGGTRHFSNRYHFTGGTPADDTHWHTLMDNVVTAEKAIFEAGTSIVEAVGYAAGSDVPVSLKTYTTAGTLTPGGSDHVAPGDCAALIRYSTNARSVKNHPIYCFNYYHQCFYNASHPDADFLSSAQKTAMGTYAAAWITGFSDGTITAKRSTPNAATTTGSIVEEYITHRDFPYTTSV
jgi:hypothetical protein